MLLLLFMGLAPGTRAGDAPEQGAIRQVIEGQLAAFQRDDGALAFSFASPGIQGQFGSAERFMDMVRSAYAPVYRPREVEFRDLGLDGGRLVQRVLLVGPDGVPVIARYVMEQAADGTWKIAGCSIERSPELTT